MIKYKNIYQHFIIGNELYIELLVGHRPKDDVRDMLQVARMILNTMNHLEIDESMLSQLNSRHILGRTS